jgi:hypothetical protein
MMTFVRILLVPLSGPLSYDFKSGGESTRDGKVKFTDLTEATGNGLAALALANTHLCKSSWTDVLKEAAEIFSMDQFFDVQYHSCMNNFEPVVWENISEFEKKYGDLNAQMLGDLILASAFYNSRAPHITKVRQILERDPEYDANSGDFANQLEKMTQFQVVKRTKGYEIHMPGAQTLFEKPSLTRAEAELKKKEQEGKTQKFGGLKKGDGGGLTFTASQVPEVLKAVCVHFGVDTHPPCDKCHMRHNPAGGCIKAELAVKAFELSGPLVKSVAQAELSAKQSVIKAKEKEIRSCDIKVLENVVTELHNLGISLNKMFQQTGSVRGKDNNAIKKEYAKGKDCYHWLNGDCNRKECMFRHDPSTKGKGKDPAAGKPDKDPAKTVKDLLTHTATDDKNQDCRLWAHGQCVKGSKCPHKHDPAKGHPHKDKETNSEMPKEMQGIMARLAQLEAVTKTPSASVEQTHVGTGGEKLGQSASRDILSIPERTKRAAEAAGVTS